uniref:Cytoskeleton associated protein 2-like n=1 Tax=Oryzias latipes TaxID=8090 RepID=A0A3P9IX83_ORYLA
MEAEEPAAELSRKELRKLKLMEYLAAKGKRRPPEAKAHPQQRPHEQKPASTHPPKVVVGKENKVPAAGIQPVAPKTWTTQSSQNPPRKSTLTDLQPAGRAAAPPNKRTSVLTRTYTVVSSKVGAAAGGSIRTQTGGKKATILAPSSSKSSLCSVAAAPSCPSARMSVGPCVKTRTGLIPAVLQPKSTNLNPTLVYAKAPKTAMRSTAVLPRSVSHKPAASFPSTVQNGIKSSVKAVQLKSTPAACKSRLTGTSSSSTNKPELLKPKGVPATKRPQNPPTKARPAAKEERRNQPDKVAPQTSSKSGRFSSRPEPVKTSKDRNPTKTPTQARSKHAGASGISQTAPQPSRNITFTGRADAKMPKVTVKAGPQTEGKKPSTAQEERLRKLQEWREAKGISYKRPPMQVKTPARRPPPTPPLFWPSMQAEDEAHSLICAVDQSLADCIKLLAEGCPADQVRGVLSRLPPVSQKFAKYWICRARLMEQEGNPDVLPLFQEAVRVVLEPVDELRTVVFDILKKKDELRVLEEEEAESGPTAAEPLENHHNPTVTPKPVRALINEEQGGSSVVKYKITATPGGPPSQRRESVKVNGQEVRFFTPVRRSVRIERASLQHPAALHDHDLCVTSYRHLMSEEDAAEGESPPATPVYIYRENEALKDKVFIQLICDEDPQPRL